MIAKLLSIAGLILQPLLVLPIGCACDLSDCLDCCCTEATRTCCDDGPTATTEHGCGNNCGCSKPSTSQSCCSAHHSSNCLTTQTPVCVLSLTLADCPCGCCSGPMAPLSGSAESDFSSHLNSGPAATVSKTPDVLISVDPRFAIAKATRFDSYGTLQQRLCVWLN